MDVCLDVATVWPPPSSSIAIPLFPETMILTYRYKPKRLSYPVPVTAHFYPSLGRMGGIGERSSKAADVQFVHSLLSIRLPCPPTQRAAAPEQIRVLEIPSQKDCFVGGKKAGSSIPLIVQLLPPSQRGNIVVNFAALKF